VAATCGGQGTRTRGQHPRTLLPARTRVLPYCSLQSWSHLLPAVLEPFPRQPGAPAFRGACRCPAPARPCATLPPRGCGCCRRARLIDDIATRLIDDIAMRLINDVTTRLINDVTTRLKGGATGSCAADARAAQRWWKRAAAEGEADAAYNLALGFAEGPAPRPPAHLLRTKPAFSRVCDTPLAAGADGARARAPGAGLLPGGAREADALAWCERAMDRGSPPPPRPAPPRGAGTRARS